MKIKPFAGVRPPKELAKEVEKMGAVFMDAPVSGGKWQLK